ncbi:Histidine phosphatase superfamily, clade-2-containing protein [Strongyloides ratti]|uniref:acid phosphatase n=1 Tax=Strongyloides ratti TaxID=34506 RepID=A0A090KTN0_STRRB|nr:Histidine phosphatase superfamily, clade-2-containing protein [Strongyloides ratti]CEF60751.1 Histidine phosphatase superfamily, clade-2-containing protein [Strongyloides ratti]
MKIEEDIYIIVSPNLKHCFIRLYFNKLYVIKLHLPLAYCSDNATLIFIQGIWRHGDRSPTEKYPGSLNDENEWPQGWGQLSPLGMKEHVLLGKKIKNRYYDQLKFVNKKYYSHDIYVRSTDVNRTIISAISNFIGFYKNSVDKNDVPNIPDWPSSYIPIPVHTINDDIDIIANPDSQCPRRYVLYDLLKETPEYKNLTQKCDKILKYLSTNTNTTITLENLWIVRDGIFIEKTNNKKLPKWLNDSIFSEIEECDDTMDDLENGYNIAPYKNLDIGLEISKLRGGAMLNEIVNRMEVKKKCNEKDKSVEGNYVCNLKYYVYSAHDTTVASFLTVLGKGVKSQLVPYGLPHYSAATFIELWYDNDKKDYFVKTLYVYPPNGTFGIDLEEKKFCKFNETSLENPNENNFCDFTKILPNNANGLMTLDQFSKNAQPYNIQSYSSLCLNTNVNFGNGNNAVKTTAVSSFIMFVCIFMQFILSK